MPFLVILNLPFPRAMPFGLWVFVELAVAAALEAVADACSVQGTVAQLAPKVRVSPLLVAREAIATVDPFWLPAFFEVTGGVGAVVVAGGGDGAAGGTASAAVK